MSSNWSESLIALALDDRKWFRQRKRERILHIYIYLHLLDGHIGEVGVEEGLLARHASAGVDLEHLLQ
jgi:hypothetical protein